MVMYGNIFVILLLSYFSCYLLLLLNKNFRYAVKGTNNRLDELRQVKIKTVDEQREFINLKFPKRFKSKITFLSVIRIIGFIILFMGIVYLYSIIFNLLHIQLRIWQALIIIMILPILINIILMKWKLDRDNLMNYLK